jgi:hypothetical protein
MKARRAIRGFSTAKSIPLGLHRPVGSCGKLSSKEGQAAKIPTIAACPGCCRPFVVAKADANSVELFCQSGCGLSKRQKDGPPEGGPPMLLPYV